MLEFSRQQERASRHLAVVSAVLGVGMPGPTRYCPVLKEVLNGVKCCGSAQQKKTYVPGAVKGFQAVLEKYIEMWNYTVELVLCATLPSL